MTSCGRNILGRGGALLGVQIGVPHQPMMCSWVMLGKIVRQIINARSPVDKEVALLDSVAHPIEAHVNRFGAALADGGVDDARRSGVVRL